MDGIDQKKTTHWLFLSSLILFLQEKFFKRFKIPKWVMVGLFALWIAFIPLSYRLSPWFNVYSIPVHVFMNAPGTLKSSMCWGKAPENCAPLVAYTQKSEYSGIWISELPAFPDYEDLYIQIDQAFNIQFDKIIFDNPRLLNSPILTIDKDNYSSLIKFENITVNGSSWASAGNGKIILPYISHEPLDWWKIWGMLVLLTIILGISAIFFWKGPPVNIGAEKFKFNRRRVLIFLAIISFIQIMIVQNAQVIFNGGDTNSYMLKAVSLVETGSYDTKGFEYELNRTPGYPLFLAAIFKIFGYQLSNVSLIQAIFYAVAVCLLVFSLRNLVPDWLLIFAGGAAMMSPPAVHFNTELLSESFFLSLGLCCSAIFIEYIRKKSYRLLILYSVIACMAFFVRANGVIFFLFPIIFILKEIIEHYKNHKESFTFYSICKISLPIFVVIGFAVFFTGAWSIRNYVNRHYFGLSDYGNLTTLAGQFFTGTFDFRSLTSSTWLADYFREKYTRKNEYYVWDLRPQIYKDITDNYKNEDEGKIKQLDDILGGISKRSDELVTWEYKVVSYIRDARWSFVIEPLYDGSRPSINFSLDYSAFRHKYAQDTSALLNKNIIHDQRLPGLINALYSKVTFHYNNSINYLIIATLLSSLYFLRKNLLFSFPFLIFMLNILILVILRNVALPRYIQILFPFICFQLAFNVYQISSDIFGAIKNGHSSEYDPFKPGANFFKNI